jgi:hypothetical protein
MHSRDPTRSIVHSQEDSMADRTWDPKTDERIAKLHPKVRDDVTKFINRVEQDLKIRLRITQGLRTFAEQDALFNQGRNGNPGDVVTNAKGGDSYHNYAVAFDVCEMKDNKASWDCDWPKIALIGKEMGWEWGGDWKSFKDKPHFHRSFGKSVAELRTAHGALANKDDYLAL